MYGNSSRESEKSYVQVLSKSEADKENKIIGSIVFQLQKAPELKISKIFEILLMMKANKIIEDFSFFEASLQQVFVQINNQVKKSENS